MQQFNYPTTLLYGEGSLAECAKRVAAEGFKRPFLVTDSTLVKIGLAEKVSQIFSEHGVKCITFSDVHPNPLEEDVEKGAAAYKKENCDAVIALGGGSPMDAAKGIMLAATHDEPLSVYDDAIGGDRRIIHPLPYLYAIPTTAGTGSEVGRAGVIVLRETNNKTILFHPTMLPKIAVLEPSLTIDLPPHITAATGIDAFTHCLEAFFAKGFHPMADGIALEGIRLILKNLPLVLENGKDVEARGKMLLAASMGATAFQKGLGMIHSMAHPLSSECGLHHGLANALVLPASVHFLESAQLNSDQRERFRRVQALFKDAARDRQDLSASCKGFIEATGIKFGLRNHEVLEGQLGLLADKAVKDSCHGTNMISVSREDFFAVLQDSF